MFALDRLALAPETLLFAASIALAATVMSLVGCAAAWHCRHCEAPVRHAVLLATIGIALASPILLAIGSPFQSAWLRIDVRANTAQSSAIDSNARSQIRSHTIGTQIKRPSFAVSYEHSRAAGISHVDSNSPTASGWQRWGTALAVTWALGALIGIVGTVRGLLIVRRFMRTLDAAPRPRLVAAVGDAFRSVGSTRRARILVTRLAPAPLSLGLLRPAIIVPEFLAADSAADRLRYVLTHEVAHVVRRDQWVALLQRVAIILFWWNPLLRILSRQLSHVREEICDDYVLRAEGEGRRFAATLLDVAERTALLGLPTATALLDDDAQSLEKRVRRLLKPRPNPETRVNGRTLITIMVFGVLLSAIALTARVQSYETSPAEAARLQTGSPSAVATKAYDRNSLLDTRNGAAIRDTAQQALSANASRTAASPNQGEERKESLRDLSGDWLLTLPAGFEHHVMFTYQGKNRYRLAPGRLNMSGVYQLEGDRLRLVEPKDARLTEFRWQVQGTGTLLLVEEPPAGKTGARYLGATMTRPVREQLGDSEEDSSDER